MSKPESTQQKDTSQSTKSQNTTTTKSATTKPPVNGINIHNNNSIRSNKDNNHINHIKSNNTKDEKSTDENEQLNGHNNNEKKQSKESSKPIELIINLDVINEKYLRETQEIYYSQCPSLRANEAKQYDLFTLASIGRSNNNYPLLLNLIDCYLRDKFKYFLDNPTTSKSISEQDWCNNYKIVKKLVSKCKLNAQRKERLKDVIQSAIKTYFRRYCQPLLLPTPYQIRDSIQKFIQYMHEMGGLIAAIKQNPIEILPFQIDLVIIPRDVFDTANEEENDSENDSDSFESNSDDESDSDDDSDAMPIPNTNRWSAEIGNIKNRLEYNNIKYSHSKGIKVEREFRNLYREYTQKICDVPKNIKNKKELVDNIGTDLQRFPHRKRLCIVVDRRIKEKENDDENDVKNNNNDEVNDIYLFEPPLFNELPKNHIREWHIESSYKCIIPGYKKQAITSKSSLDGWINVFSFHIVQEDEIRCYFYRGGQILRFMPKDIKDLFQYLFDLKKFNNNQFVNGNTIQNDIQRMKNTWNDTHFDKFREMLT